MKASLALTLMLCGLHSAAAQQVTVVPPPAPVVTEPPPKAATAATDMLPAVTLPADTTASPGDLVPVEIKYTGDDIKIKVSKGLTVFRVYDPDATRYALMLYVPPKAADGVYEITAVAVLKGKLSEFASCTVTVGAGPGPGPFDRGKKGASAPSAPAREYRPLGFQQPNGSVVWVVSNRDAREATASDSKHFATNREAAAEADRLNAEENKK